MKLSTVVTAIVIILVFALGFGFISKTFEDMELGEYLPDWFPSAGEAETTGESRTLLISNMKCTYVINKTDPEFIKNNNVDGYVGSGKEITGITSTDKVLLFADGASYAIGINCDVEEIEPGYYLVTNIEPDAAVEFGD